MSLKLKSPLRLEQIMREKTIKDKEGGKDGLRGFTKNLREKGNEKKKEERTQAPCPFPQKEEDQPQPVPVGKRGRKKKKNG